MESDKQTNRSSSSINSYTFSSIGSITSIIFDWNHLFHNFHALSSTIQISTALPFPFSLVLPIPTVLLIPSMPLIWLFSFHQFRQFDQFLLILIQSLISLIAIILIVADSPNKTSQKNQKKFIQLASIFHNWWSWQLQQFSHAIPPICFFHSVALYPSGSNSSVKSICNSISLIRSIYMVNTIFP